MLIEILYRLSAILVLVLFHELGHLLASKLCGIKVTAFSLGFGKPYLHKKVFGIDWRLSPIPLGGYCQLAGTEDKRKDGFLAQPYRNKVFVLVAGALVNIGLAFVCYLIQYRSISIGLRIDWEFAKLLFGREHIYNAEYWSNVAHLFKPNWWLIYFSTFSFFSGILNLLPIPVLDGGHIWVTALEKFFKTTKGYVRWYKFINEVGIVILVILHILMFMYWWKVI